jgi:Flp pilus assembly protein TadD
LATAVSHGLPALEALAQKFPSDPQVHMTLASEQARAQRFEAAVESIERAITVDAKVAQNGKVMGILWRAAQSSATEPSFAALRKLGAKGSDIAFDLATTSGVRDSVRERAKTELKSLPSDTSADTRVATELLLASDCDARKALLARAEHEGGKRTQSLLEQYSRGSTCTSNTDKACNACLTGSPELTHALAQLNAGATK